MTKRINIHTLIILVIIIFILTNCASDKINSPQENGTIEGKVSDSISENGIENIMIELERDNYPYADTTTDKSGFYNFQDVTPGIYTLITIKYGYDSSKDTVTVYTGNITIADLEVSLGDLVGTWNATNLYIPQLDQNFIISELGIEMEINFSENGEYHGITSDSLSSSVNAGNWYTSNGFLIILDSEIGERQGKYTREENILTLNNWKVDYQGVSVSLDITLIKK